MKKLQDVPSYPQLRELVVAWHEAYKRGDTEAAKEIAIQRDALARVCVTESKS